MNLSGRTVVANGSADERIERTCTRLERDQIGEKYWPKEGLNTQWCLSVASLWGEGKIGMHLVRDRVMRETSVDEMEVLGGDIGECRRYQQRLFF